MKCASLPTCPVVFEELLVIGMPRLLISLGCSHVATLFPESSQTVDGGLGGHGSGRGQLIGATCNLFVCGLALPDADSESSNAILKSRKTNSVSC